MHNENKSRTTQTQSSSVSNLNVEGNEGVTLVNPAGAVTLTQTDHGAVEGSLSFASDALNSTLDAQQHTTNRAFDFGQDAVNLVGDTINDAASFLDNVIGRAMDANEYTTGRAFDQNEFSLNTIADLNSNSIDFMSALVGDVIDATKTLARDSAESNAGFLSDALGGFQKLAVQNSESSDDKMTRVIGYALAAVVAALVLPTLFKGGGKAVI